MKRTVTILFIMLLLGLCGGSCGEDELPRFTKIVFLDAPGGNCKALEADRAYTIQIQFIEFSGAPATDHPDVFNIIAREDNSLTPVGWFEGPGPTRNANPYDTTPPGTVFSLIYRTPDDITTDTDIIIELLPSPLLQWQQGLCTITP